MSGTVQLERVRWRLDEGRLYRDVWPAIDSPADVKPEEVPIVSEVKSLQWRFYRNGWLKSWTDSAHQPDGVELTLTMENGDTWRWVFTTPGDRPEASVSAPKERTDAPAPAPEVKP